MNFADIWNTSQEDYYILFNKRLAIVRFLLFEQYGVKMLITSFCDTQYSFIFFCGLISFPPCNIKNIVNHRDVFFSIERMRTPVRHFSYGIRHYPVHTLLSRMYGTITTDAGSPVFGIPGLLH